MNMPTYSIKKTEKDKTGEVRLTAEISKEFLAECEKISLEDIQKDLELPGFRKGKVPLDIARSSISPYAILKNAVDLAIKEIFPELIRTEKLTPITEPEAEIIKLAPQNPVEVIFHIYTEPEFNLPDYKKIGKLAATSLPPVKTEDSEVNDVIKQVLEIRKAKDSNGKEAVPELTLDYVKTLGNFESIESFREQIKNNLNAEKEQAVQQKIREKIIEELTRETKMPLPEKLITKELEEMTNHRKKDLEANNISLEDYLKRINRTAEELKNQDKKYIEDKFKIRHIFSRIAKEEKLTPNESDSDKNVELFMGKYPNADPEAIRSYVNSALLNEAVMTFLETKETKPN